MASSENPSVDQERRDREEQRILVGLNQEQLAAVTAPADPLLIFAGAGTGKTKVLTARIAWLVETKKAKAEEICAVTFTNKAAREMRGRVRGMIGHEAAGMSLGTFHALGQQILRADDHAERLGLDANFTLYDDADTRKTFMRAAENVNFDFQARNVRPGEVMLRIEQAKDELLTPEACFDLAVTERDEAEVAVYQEYQNLMRSAYAVDFSDLLLLPCQLFERYPEVLAKYHERFRWILVDEYQDTNHAQFQFVSALAAKHRQITAVGDDDQAIYAFRFADVRNILDFRDLYQDAKIITLEQNYRSPQLILDAGTAVVRNNSERMDKNLWTTRKEGSKISLLSPMDEEEEADTVVTEIERLMGEGMDLTMDRDGELHPTFSILFRTNRQSRAFEAVLLQRGLAYQMVGGIRFYDRREVKDAIAYLRLLANPADLASFERAIAAPRRGVGENALRRVLDEVARTGLPVMTAIKSPAVVGMVARPARAGLEEFAGIIDKHRAMLSEKPLDEVLDSLMEESGYRAYLERGGKGDDGGRPENLDELVGLCAEFQDQPEKTALSAFLDNAALVSDQDDAEKEKPGVQLITIHKCKGLEYPVVFLAGAEEGILPSQMSQDEAALAEERRLAYVAITRTRELLYISACRTRYRFGGLDAETGIRHRGRREEVDRSRYVDEIPGELTMRKEIPAAVRARTRVRGRTRRGQPGAGRGVERAAFAL